MSGTFYANMLCLGNNTKVHNHSQFRLKFSIDENGIFITLNVIQIVSLV